MDQNLSPLLSVFIETARFHADAMKKQPIQMQVSAVQAGVNSADMVTAQNSTREEKNKNNPKMVGTALLFAIDRNDITPDSRIEKTPVQKPLVQKFLNTLKFLVDAPKIYFAANMNMAKPLMAVVPEEPDIFDLSDDVSSDSNVLQFVPRKYVA